MPFIFLSSIFLSDFLDRQEEVGDSGLISEPLLVTPLPIP